MPTRRKTTWLADVHGISEFINGLAGVSTIGQVLERAFGFLRRLYGDNYYSLWLHDGDPEKNGLLLFGEDGFRKVHVGPEYNQIQVGTGAIGLAVKLNRPLMLDMQNKKHASIPLAKEFITAEKIQTLLCVPCVFEGKVRGGLVVGSHNKPRWTSEDVDGLSFLTDQAITRIEDVTQAIESNTIIEILMEASISNKLDDFISSMAKHLSSMFEADLCYIRVFGGRSGSPEAVGYYPRRDAEVRVGNRDSLQEWVLRKNRAIRLFHIGEKKELELYDRGLQWDTGHAESLGITGIFHHYLCAPIVLPPGAPYQRGPIGTILIIREPEKRGFLLSQEQTLVAIGRYLGVASSWIQLLSEIRLIVEAEDKFAEALVTPDTNGILNNLLSTAIGVTHSKAGYISLSESGTGNVSTEYEIGDLSFMYKGIKSIVQENEEMAIKKGQPIDFQIGTLRSQIGTKPETPYESGVIIPLFVETRPAGVMALFSDRTKAYGQRQLSFVKSAGSQAVTAAENMNKLRLASRRLVALLDTARTLNEASDVNDVLSTVAKESARIFEADIGVIAILEDGKLRIRASYGLDETQIERIFITKKAIINSVLADQIVVAIKDTTNANGYERLLPDLPVQSAIIAPILDGGESVGVLNLESFNESAYNPADQEGMELARLLSIQASTAYSRARLEAGRIEMDSRLNERTRLATAGTISIGLGHEMKNGLNNILAIIRDLRSERITDGKESDRLEQLSDIVEKEAKRLTNLAYRVMDLSRRDIIKKITYLNEIVSSFSTLLSKRVKEKGMTLALSLDPSLSRPDDEKQGAPIYADENQIGQVLINLVRNSIDAYADAGRKTGKIEVSTLKARKSDREYAVLKVVDHGIGFDEEEKKRFLRPFESGKSGGVGIGLTLVNTIVEDHGGDLEVWGKKWSGASFSVLIPICEERHKHGYRS